MKTLRTLWIEIRIFLEFFYVEIKRDFKSLFNATTSTQTYTGFFSGLVKDFRKALTRPRYHVYYSVIFLVISIAKYRWYVILFAGLLTLYLYFRYIWITGEPLKFYKERYFERKV